MTGVGEHYYELHAGRRGHAAADETMLRAVTFIRKRGERAHFSQDEQGTRIILERVTQNQHAIGCAVGRLRTEGWSIRVPDSGPSLPRTSSLPQATSQISSLKILRVQNPSYKLAAMILAAYSSMVYDTTLQ